MVVRRPAPKSGTLVPMTADASEDPRESDHPDSLVRAAAAAPDVHVALVGPGVVIRGTYRIESPLGRGGMGIVWRALDERLDRPVAIKFQHRPSDEFERLRREARALASLSHPNVVTVLEIGEHDGATFIVMELVDGGNAREWAQQRPRSWREIVALYREAGEGLAAAHGVGIVHRDFKPDNVLVGIDRGGVRSMGRVRVADFGIARAAGATDASARRSLESAAELRAAPHGASSSHAFLGTPAYMAPEQLASSRVDARADQFSFCVSLYEALYEEPPFRSMAERSGLSAARVPHPRDASRTPAWVLHVLQRGLSLEPSARWSSMTELLTQLDRGGRNRRWLRAASIPVAVALVIVVASRGSTPEPRCVDAGALDDAWNPGRAEQIDAALRATGAPGIDETMDRLRTRLDAHVTGWRQAWRTACADSDGLRLDADLSCLRARKRTLVATVELLEHADLTTAKNAANIGAALEDPERCLDGPTLGVAPPAELAADIDALRVGIAGARAQTISGHYHEGSALIDPIVASAHALGYRPLLAEALVARGTVREAQERHADAQADLVDGYLLALGERLDPLALEAASLVPVTLAALGRPAEAEVWFSNARALFDDSPRRRKPRVRALLAEGHVLTTLGRLDEAETVLHEGLVLAAAVADDGVMRSDALSELANLEFWRGRFDRAVEQEQLALAIKERVFGRENPRTAHALERLAAFALHGDRREESRAAFVRSIAILERWFGRDDVSLVGPLTELAHLDTVEGKHAEALVRLEHVRTIAVANHQPPDPVISEIDGIMGLALAGLGRGADAIVAYRRELEALEVNRGYDHPELRFVLNNLSLAGRDCGRSNDAELWLRRAIAIDDALAAHDYESPTLHANLGFLVFDRGELEAAELEFSLARTQLAELGTSESHDAAFPLLGLGLVASRRGQPELTVRLLERALALWDVGTSSWDHRRARRELALALWKEGRDRPRALALAREGLADAPDDDDLQQLVRRGDRSQRHL
jgi:eukaryotic-like serine/threonine-protein kinase